MNKPVCSFLHSVFFTMHLFDCKELSYSLLSFSFWKKFPSIYQWREPLIWACRALFLFLCVLQAIFPQFGLNLIPLILSSPAQRYTARLQFFIEYQISNSPFGFFLLIHAFLCFSFFHFFMIYGIGIDLFFEYIFQLFNLFRLVLFPLVISAFVSAHLERQSFAMWDILSDVEKLEKTRDFAKKVSDFLSQTYIKNPKTTRARAGALGTLAGVFAWGWLHFR